jgi:hypothetical protein
MGNFKSPSTAGVTIIFKLGSNGINNGKDAILDHEGHIHEHFDNATQLIIIKWHSCWGLLTSRCCHLCIISSMELKSIQTGNLSKASHYILIKKANN